MPMVRTTAIHRTETWSHSAKVKTVVQELAIALALLPPVAEGAEWLHVGVLWAAVVLTIGTGISYVTDGTRSLSKTGDRR